MAGRWAVFNTGGAERMAAHWAVLQANAADLTRARRAVLHASVADWKGADRAVAHADVTELADGMRTEWAVGNAKSSEEMCPRRAKVGPDAVLTRCGWSKIPWAIFNAAVGTIAPQPHVAASSPRRWRNVLTVVDEFRNALLARVADRQDLPIGTRQLRLRGT